MSLENRLWTENLQLQAFGLAICKARGATPLGVAAELAGMSDNTWARIEKGNKQPRLKTYIKIAHSLDLSPEEEINIMGLTIGVSDLWFRLESAAQNPVDTTEGSLGQRIQLHREGLGMGYVRLATITGIERTQLYKIEHDNFIPKVPAFVRIADGLKLSPDQTLNLMSSLESNRPDTASQ